MTDRSGHRSALRLAALQELAKRVQHVHGLVEQYAAAAQYGNGAHFMIPLRRAFGQLKVAFLDTGLDALSQLAGSMEVAASRAGIPVRTVRVLREGVASMRFQLEAEQRSARGGRHAGGEGGADAGGEAQPSG